MPEKETNERQEVQKRGRGRPKVVPDENMKLLRRMFQDVHTDRSLQNYDYHARAAKILEGLDGFTWLLDTSHAAIGEPPSYRRRTILSGLGREPDPERLIAMARRICEFKPTSKDSRAMIRRWRRGQAKPADPLALANELIEAINGYATRHPDLSHEQIRTALLSIIGKLE